MKLTEATNFIRKSPAAVFAVVFLLICFYYDFHTILLKRPQSTHHWRQTECTSLALNYYQNGMKFSEPEIHFQIADDFTSGYTVGEFPGFYYLVASLYHVFGISEPMYRLLVLSLFFGGLFAFYKIAEHLLQSAFWAACLSLLFFTSPVVVYYSNNFLTDIPAFALSLMAWYFFYRFYLTQRNFNLFVCCTLFALAGLLKITAAASILFLVTVFVFERISFLNKSKKRIFHQPFLHIFSLLAPLLLIGAWYFVAIEYNKMHNVVYFSTRTWPIWDLDSDTIAQVKHNVWTYWRHEYFHTSVFVLFAACFLSIIAFAPKINRFFLLGTIVFSAGTMLFILLWFLAFQDHDYYIINLLILPMLLLLGMFELLKRKFPQLLKSPVLKVLFVGFLIFNVHCAKGKIYERYYSWKNEFPQYKDVHEAEPYLRSIGIQRTDKIISIPDDATNYTLYLMNQPGWTETMGFKMDSTTIEFLRNKGAKYLIITDREKLSREDFAHFIKNKKGEYGSISIFELGE
jgi:hypothetical protein